MSRTIMDILSVPPMAICLKAYDVTHTMFLQVFSAKARCDQCGIIHSNTPVTHTRRTAHALSDKN